MTLMNEPPMVYLDSLHNPAVNFWLFSFTNGSPPIFSFPCCTDLCVLWWDKLGSLLALFVTIIIALSIFCDFFLTQPTSAIFESVFCSHFEGYHKEMGVFCHIYTPGVRSHSKKSLLSDQQFRDSLINIRKYGMYYENASIIIRNK